MKRPLFKLPLLVAAPLALLLVARERASWRPQKMASLPAEPLIFAPDQHLYAYSTWRSGSIAISVHDLLSGAEVKSRVTGHLDASTLAFAPGGQKIAWTWQGTSSQQSSAGVAIWNLKGTSRDVQQPQGNFASDEPAQLRFSPDGKTLWLASMGNLYSWDVASGRLKWQWRPDALPLAPDKACYSSLSQDCRFCFRSGKEGYTMWDTRTHKRLLQTKLPFLDAASLQFSDDGSFASYATDQLPSYFVIDTRTGRVLWHAIAQPVFSRGKAFVSNAHSRTFEVRDARTGKLLNSFPAPPEASPFLLDSSSHLYFLQNGELYRQRLP